MEEELAKLYESVRMLEDLGITLTKEQKKGFEETEKRFLHEVLQPKIKNIVEETTRGFQGEFRCVVQRNKSGEVKVSFEKNNSSSRKQLSSVKETPKKISFVHAGKYDSLKYALGKFYKDKANSVHKRLNVSDYLPTDARIVQGDNIFFNGEIHSLYWWCISLDVDGHPYKKNY